MPDVVDIPVLCSECARQKALIESDGRYQVLSCTPTAADPRICTLEFQRVAPAGGAGGGA